MKSYLCIEDKKEVVKSNIKTLEQDPQYILF